MGRERFVRYGQPDLIFLDRNNFYYKYMQTFMRQSLRPTHRKLGVESTINFPTNYEVNASKTNGNFILLDGPPYANGEAHLGHALNKIWKDIAVKSNWYFGKSVKYVPGWDCHGLPIELAIDKQFPDFSYYEKLIKCSEHADHYHQIQTESFKRLGVSAEWDNPYLTMHQSKQSWETLRKMVERDLLEYKLMPVYHCPACGSSLAEAEIERSLDNRVEFYFSYPINENESMLVWTTTPWTIPMSQAVAVNPDSMFAAWIKNNITLWVDNDCLDEVAQIAIDAGYVKSNILVSSTHFNKAHHPLTDAQIPILTANFVETGKTGFVHCAPAHGQEDFDLCLLNGIDVVSMLDVHGKYNSLAPKFLQGLKNSSCNDLIASALGDRLLVKKETKFETAKCWRHKCSVYYQATPQVFINLQKLRPTVLQMISNLDGSVRDNLERMVSTRPHWCISRQRYWGTPLNLVINNGIIDCNESIKYLTAKINACEYIPSGTVLTDVLDVWFDSGNVAYAVMRNSPSDLVIEGKDQYRGWFQSLLWISAAHGFSPFSNIKVHGFVLDEQKKKFAKSLGNGMSADQACSTYGVDVVRLWAALQDDGTDAIFSDTKMNEAKTIYQRLRLCLRFLDSYKTNADPQSIEYPTGEFFKYACGSTTNRLTSVETALRDYNYKRAITELYDLANNHMSQWIFEVLKPILYLKNPATILRQDAEKCVNVLYNQLLRITAVFCPYLAAEFYGSGDILLLNPIESPKWEVFDDWEPAKELRKFMAASIDKIGAKRIDQCYANINNDFAKFTELLDPKFWLGVSGFRLIDASSSVELAGGLKCPRCWYYHNQLSESGVCVVCDGDMLKPD